MGDKCYTSKTLYAPATYTGSSLENSLYGSSRLGVYKGGRAAGSRTLGTKNYEISNHLGNVLAVISDRKILSGSVFVADLVSASDYYPFGYEMAGRAFSSGSYKYSFNG